MTTGTAGLVVLAKRYAAETELPKEARESLHSTSKAMFEEFLTAVRGRKVVLDTKYFEDMAPTTSTATEIGGEAAA